jgi:hypothetical protein
MDRQPARPTLRQPELQPQPSHDATDCGAVAADTCTGGVGLRPPCYGYQQGVRGRGRTLRPLRLPLHVRQVALLARDYSDAGTQRRQ